MSSSFIIQSQKFELSIYDKSQVQSINERISQYVKQRMPVLMKQIAQEFPDRYIRIDKLELDLSCVSIEAIEDQLDEKIASQLRRVFKQHVGITDQSTLPLTFGRSAEVDWEWDRACKEFLRDGNLPDQLNEAEFVELLIRSHLPILLVSYFNQGHVRKVRERLARALSDSQFERVCQAMSISEPCIIGLFALHKLNQEYHFIHVSDEQFWLALKEFCLFEVLKNRDIKRSPKEFIYNCAVQSAWRFGLDPTSYISEIQLAFSNSRYGASQDATILTLFSQLNSPLSYEELKTSSSIASKWEADASDLVSYLRNGTISWRAKGDAKLWLSEIVNDLLTNDPDRLRFLLQQNLSNADALRRWASSWDLEIHLELLVEFKITSHTRIVEFALALIRIQRLEKIFQVGDRKFEFHVVSILWKQWLSSYEQSAIEVDLLHNFLQMVMLHTDTQASLLFDRVNSVRFDPLLADVQTLNQTTEEVKRQLLRTEELNLPKPKMVKGINHTHQIEFQSQLISNFLEFVLGEYARDLETQKRSLRQSITKWARRKKMGRYDYCLCVLNEVDFISNSLRLILHQLNQHASIEESACTSIPLSREWVQSYIAQGAFKTQINEFIDHVTHSYTTNETILIDQDWLNQFIHKHALNFKSWIGVVEILIRQSGVMHKGDLNHLLCEILGAQTKRVDVFKSWCQYLQEGELDLSKSGLWIGADLVDVLLTQVNRFQSWIRLDGNKDEKIERILFHSDMPQLLKLFEVLAPDQAHILLPFSALLYRHSMAKKGEISALVFKQMLLDILAPESIQAQQCAARAIDLLAGLQDIPADDLLIDLIKDVMVCMPPNGAQTTLLNLLGNIQFEDLPEYSRDQRVSPNSLFRSVTYQASELASTPVSNFERWMRLGYFPSNWGGDDAIWEAIYADMQINPLAYRTLINRYMKNTLVVHRVYFSMPIEIRKRVLCLHFHDFDDVAMQLYSIWNTLCWESENFDPHLNPLLLNASYLANHPTAQSIDLSGNWIAHLVNALQNSEKIQHLSKKLVHLIEHEFKDAAHVHQSDIDDLIDVSMRRLYLVRAQQNKNKLSELSQSHAKVSQFEFIKNPSSSPQDIFVDNGGIVLLWQYFPLLFNRFGLLKGERFRDQASRDKAIWLLQYLVFQRFGSIEGDCALNKILCGATCNQSLDVVETLNAEEIEYCENIVNALRRQWPQLRQASNEFVRENFIRRKAKLSKTVHGWRLQLGRGPFDLLLRSLPWKINEVNFPWMDTTLSVEWDAS